MPTPPEVSRAPRAWARLGLATLLAPLALVPVMVLWQLAIVVAAGGVRQSTGAVVAAAVVSGFLLGGFGLWVAFPVTVVYLLPVALVLRRLGRAPGPALVGAGGVGGGVFGFPEGLFSVVFYASCGAAVAVAFWAIGRPGLARPPTGVAP